MAFEDVNVERLRSAIRACKSSINYSSEKEIINTLSNDNVWQCQSKTKLKVAMQTLTNERYAELKEKLETYETIVNNIEKYQALVKDNKSMVNESMNLQRRINNTKNSINDENKDSVNYELTTMENKRINLGKRINQNRDKMEVLYKKIVNSI